MSDLKQRLIKIGEEEKAEKVARKYMKRTTKEKMEEFKRRADGDLDKQMEVADELFKKIGSGRESHVYEIDSEKVLQISNPKTNKKEYHIFSDPQFDDLTPDVFDRGSEWGWITMEKAELIEPRNPTYNRMKEIAEQYVGRVPDPIGSLVASISAGEPPEGYDGNPFFDGLAEIYKKIGKKPRDMIAENFGFIDDQLVLIDIAT